MRARTGIVHGDLLERRRKAQGHYGRGVARTARPELATGGHRRFGPDCGPSGEWSVGWSLHLKTRPPLS